MVTAGLPACLDEYCPFPCLPFVRQKSSKNSPLPRDVESNAYPGGLTGQGAWGISPTTLLSGLLYREGGGTGSQRGELPISPN